MKCEYPIIYTFPKSGNRLITTMFSALEEKNEYWTYFNPRVVDTAQPVWSFNAERYLEFSTHFGDATDQFIRDRYSKSDTYPKTVTEIFKDRRFIVKTHTKPIVTDKDSEKRVIIIVLRRPTDILRSHVNYQWLGVEEFNSNIHNHSRYVYLDQLRYLEEFLTLKPCLVNGQDNYLQVIIHALSLPNPLFFIDYLDVIRDPQQFLSDYLSFVDSKTEFDLGEVTSRTSKQNSLRTQEDYLNKIYSGNNFPDYFHNVFESSSAWAYRHNFRQINKNKNVQKSLEGLPECNRADEIYHLIKRYIPTEGIIINNEDFKNMVTETILDVITSKISRYKKHQSGHNPLAVNQYFN